MAEKEKKEKKGKKEEPRQEKRGYIIEKDLKAAGPLVHNCRRQVMRSGLQGLLTLQTSCNGRTPLDLESEGYDFEDETDADEINRTMAWLLVSLF